MDRKTLENLFISHGKGCSKAPPDESFHIPGATLLHATHIPSFSLKHNQQLRERNLEAPVFTEKYINWLQVFYVLMFSLKIIF